MLNEARGVTDEDAKTESGIYCRLLEVDEEVRANHDVRVAHDCRQSESKSLTPSLVRHNSPADSKTTRWLAVEEAVVLV